MSIEDRLRELASKSCDELARLREKCVLYQSQVEAKSDEIGRLTHELEQRRSVQQDYFRADQWYGRRIAELEAENRALKHDIGRHVAICSELEVENARLRESKS